MTVDFIATEDIEGYHQIMGYFRRVIDEVLNNSLDAMGGVVIEGARACGKTSTGLNAAKSSVRLDESPQMIELADLNPSELLKGETPRLIDEWQLAPTLWNGIRHEIDERQKSGQFILTGSATPHDDITRHSGAGRFARLRMRPMALFESKKSSGQVSLSKLFDGITSVSATSPLTYMNLAEEAVKGGWPALVSQNAEEKRALAFNRAYLENIYGTDIPLAAGVNHDPIRLQRLMESLSRNISTEATNKKLSADVSADGGELRSETVSTYLDALNRIFIEEDLSAWSVALRSKSRLRTSPKHYFTDPSLACASLGAGAERLGKDPEWFGQVFENMAVRDLRTYIQPLDGKLYYYRDNTGLEIDCIVELPDGRWAGIEAKLGSAKIPEAESHLLSLKNDRVDTTKVGEPTFLAVVTGTQYAYTLPSGIHVIPLATLRD
jgi:predicted AAA+ superfamily ATPase